MKSKPVTQHNYFVRVALKEISLIRKYFGIRGRGDKVTVTKELSSRDIHDFFREYFAAVRPSRLSDDKIYPQPSPTKLKALYVGQPDANIVLNFVVRHCLYVDQIILIDPYITLEHEDIKNRPEVWGQVIINRALCLCALEEWIEQEIVLIVPSVFYYDPEAQIRLINEYEKKGLKIDDKQFKEFGKQFTIRLLVDTEPEARESVFDLLASMGRRYTEGERESLLEEAAAYEAQNPIRFRLPISYFEKNFKGAETISQIFDMALGIPLFLSPLVSETLNAFILFENDFLYHLLSKNVDIPKRQTNSFEELGIAFQKLDFPFLNNVSLDKALEIRNKGYLQSFRIYLKELWSTVSKLNDDVELETQILDFSDRLKSEYSQLEREWQQIRNEAYAQAAVSGAVVGLSVVATGGFSLSIGALAGISAGIIKEHFKGYKDFADKRQKTQEKPLSIFLTLKR